MQHYLMIETTSLLVVYHVFFIPLFIFQMLEQNLPKNTTLRNKKRGGGERENTHKHTGADLHICFCFRITAELELQ